MNSPSVREAALNLAAALGQQAATGLDRFATRHPGDLAAAARRLATAIRVRCDPPAAVDAGASPESITVEQLQTLHPGLDGRTVERPPFVREDDLSTPSYLVDPTCPHCNGSIVKREDRWVCGGRRLAASRLPPCGWSGADADRGIVWG